MKSDVKLSLELLDNTVRTITFIIIISIINASIMISLLVSDDIIINASHLLHIKCVQSNVITDSM